MRRFFLIVTYCLITVCVKAQGGEYFTNGHGGVFSQHHYVDVEGSPYKFDTWLPGKVINNKGVTYDNLKLKYNIYDNELTFIYDQTDSPMVFAEPVISFELQGAQKLTFANNLPPIDKQTSASYYQVLCFGKAMLLKRYIKNLIESKAYGATLSVKRFADDVAYYVYINQKITELKRTAPAVLTLMPGANNGMETFLKDNKLNLKKDTDLQKAFDYYNTHY